MEQAADALLRALPRDPACPVFTETQLARRGRRCCAFSTDAWVELLAGAPPQSALDELSFLAAVTPLSRQERACLQGWMRGWTQREICAHWTELAEKREDVRGKSAGGAPAMQHAGEAQTPTQQATSRLLRCALGKCRESVGLSFTQFSRHTLYRRPAGRRGTWRAAICPYCREEFVYGLGIGRYCSQSCREAARHRG